MTPTDTKKVKPFPSQAKDKGVPGIDKPDMGNPDDPAKPDKDPNPLAQADGVSIDDDDEDNAFEDETDDADDAETVDEDESGI